MKKPGFKKNNLRLTGDHTVKILLTLYIPIPHLEPWSLPWSSRGKEERAIEGEVSPIGQMNADTKRNFKNHPQVFSLIGRDEKTKM